MGVVLGISYCIPKVSECMPSGHYNSILRLCADMQSDIAIGMMYFTDFHE